MATDLNKYVLSQELPAKFEMRPYYSKVGDFVSFSWVAEEPFFTRRIDEYLTCYYSMRTHKVIGCKIKGIRYLVGQMKKLGSAFAGRPTIKGVSVVGRGLSERPETPDKYQEVWEKGSNVEIEDSELQPA